MKKTQPKTKRRSSGSKVPDALLAAALRAQSEGVFIAEGRAGKHGVKILFANDSFCAMTGHAPEELVGRPHGMLHIERAEVERLRRWLRRAVTGEPLVGDGLIARANGTTVSATWSFDPICDADGNCTHVVATYRDQTERRQLHEALIHAQRLDAVGRLAGGVAHDFNNLLSVINGYCEILAAHVAANPQAVRDLVEIHNAGRKAAALTQQLLAFSRRQPLNARVINLSTLVSENAEILRRLIGDAGTLDLDLAPDLANVRTDPAQFQQVLLNFVLNARDALRDHGRIIVRTANRDVKPGLNRRATDTPPGRYVVLTVSDNGTGMDAETQKHLFEPFFTTKPEGKGTGLGLALVYGVVQQSGGTITVKSEVLVGSTFEVHLPAVTAPVEDERASVAPLPSMRGSEAVLLIENDDLVRKMVAGILTADGYRVTAAKSFADAARDLPEQQPLHLLISTMAGEGEKLGRKLLAAYPNLRVLCTGETEACESVSWVKPERQACIHKPYALSELIRMSRKLLDAP